MKVEVRRQPPLCQNMYSDDNASFHPLRHLIVGSSTWHTHTKKSRMKGGESYLYELEVYKDVTKNSIAK